MRAYRHDAMPARILRSYGRKRAQEHKNTISREPDAIMPVPQWYEITEWERQIVKEQEREREGPKASER